MKSYAINARRQNGRGLLITGTRAADPVTRRSALAWGRPAFVAAALAALNAELNGQCSNAQFSTPRSLRILPALLGRGFRGSTSCLHVDAADEKY